MYRKNKLGQPYLSKSDEVGTAFCPRCLKHYEDCGCPMNKGGGRSNTRPSLSIYDKEYLSEYNYAFIKADLL
jgi:DTW domain-containing protein YfiP